MVSELHHPDNTYSRRSKSASLYFRVKINNTESKFSNVAIDTQVHSNVAIDTQVHSNVASIDTKVHSNAKTHEVQLSHVN